MRAFLTSVSSAIILVLLGCSSSSTPAPPAQTHFTYWSLFEGTAAMPGLEVAPAPLTNTSVASLTLSNSAVNNLLEASYMMFDSAGRLWVENYRDPVVVNIFQVPLTATSAPVVTLTFPNIHRGFGMALDGSGNLWISAQFGNAVYKFNGPFTTTTSLSSPALTLNMSLNEPQGLAMNAAGDLAVANSSASGTNCPGAVAIYKAPISNTAPPLLNGPEFATGVAFDSAGNLYVAGGQTATAGCSNGIVRYNAANQNNGATPDTVNSTGLPAGWFVEELSIDASGNLYFANCGTTGGILIYPTVASSFSSSLAPTTTFTDANIGVTHCVGGAVTL